MLGVCSIVVDTHALSPFTARLAITGTNTLATSLPPVMPEARVYVPSWMLPPDAPLGNTAQPPSRVGT